MYMLKQWARFGFDDPDELLSIIIERLGGRHDCQVTVKGVQSHWQMHTEITFQRCWSVTVIISLQKMVKGKLAKNNLLKCNIQDTGLRNKMK
jgi:hypothetical protein